MDYDFEIMWCDVVNNKILTIEMGVGANGKPVYRVSVIRGGRSVDTIYRDLNTAVATYKMMRRVI